MSWRALIWQRWWPALVAGIVYFLLCLLKSGPIGLVTGHTWHNWWDQSQYLLSAQAFARGDLSPENHWYPLLYSLLASPFVPVLPRNPFLLLDTLCVASMAQSLVRVARHIEVGARTALFLLLLTILWPMQLWHAWVQPWTTTLSAALIWWLMARTGDIVVGCETPSGRVAATIGLVGMLVPLARPADAVVLLILGAYGAAALAMSGRLRTRHVAAVLMGSLVPIGSYALLHLAIYGAMPSNYMRMSAEIGLSSRDIGWKASILFVDPAPWFPNEGSLLGRMPWLGLGIAGALFALMRYHGARRHYLACMLAAAAAYILVLTSYVDLLPTGLWRYNNIHYFKWILPLLGMTAWVLLRHGRAAPRSALTAVAAVLVITGWHIVPVRASPVERARRLDFAAPSGVAWQQVYFARSLIVDGARQRPNIFSYHQVPSGSDVWALALRGDDFGPEARWYGGGIAGTTWPHESMGTRPLPGSWPRAPIARWKTHLRWDPPCWLFGCTAS